MAMVSSSISCQDRVEHELGPLKFIVPSSVVDELKAIKKKGGPKRSKMAEMAIEIGTINFEIKNFEEYTRNVDELLIENAKKNRCAVATLDHELLNRLKAADVLVITLSNNRMIVANRYRP